MPIDVVDLRHFYRTPLGRAAQRLIRRQVRAFWPSTAGMTVLGLGYATPYLVPFRGEAERVVAVMPAAQGVVRWPEEEPNVVALAEETELPFADLSVDRVLLVHALEVSETLRPMMREIWRVLSGSGRLMLVVPSRRGLWARLDRTPFGQGLPYSMIQLNRLLRDTMFTPLQSSRALYFPPVRSRMLIGTAEAWEEIGQRWFTRFGGVLIAEATKEIYAPAAKPAPAQRRRVPVRPVALAPVAKPRARTAAKRPPQ